MNKMRGCVEKVRCIYLILLTIYTIMREIIPAQFIVSSNILIYGIFGLGILVILASVMTNRDYLRVRNIMWMGLFLCVCIITSLVHYRYALVDNAKAICWMSLFFFLVYPSGYASVENRTKEMAAVFRAAVITMTLLMLVSLPMYFFNVDYSYYNSNLIGEIGSQGFSNDFMRLWGVFGDASIGAVYSTATAMMACYLFTKSKRIFSRVLLGFSVVLFSIYIVLSGSRAALVAVAATGAWLGFYALAAGKKLRIGKLLTSVLCAGLAAAIGIGSVSVVRLGLPYAKDAVLNNMNSSAIVQIHDLYETVYAVGKVDITDNYELVQPDPGDPVPDAPDYEVDNPDIDVPPSGSLDRTDLDEKDDISNGRLSKWMDALEIFSHSPIIGASPRGTMLFGQQHCPDNEISLYGVAAHNFVLEILMATGLIGIVLVLIILLTTAIGILKRSFTAAFSTETLFIGAIAVGLIFASLFLSDLFFVLTFGSLSFWYALGCLNRRPVISRGEDTDESKKHVLIYGPKDPAGGVEKIVFEYVRHIVEKHEDITFDFLQYGSDFSMEESIKAIGCRVLYVPSRKDDMKGYKKAIENVFRSTSYVAVWGNYSGLTNVDLLTLAKKYGVPVRIAHSHGSRLYWGSPIMKYVVFILHYFNKLFRLTGSATHYWTCSGVAGSFMFPKSVQRQIEIIPNAVDTATFHPEKSIGQAVRRSLNIDADALVLGHVARICEVKNQPFLLRVMAELVKIRPDAKLLFVGDGELREQIIDEIQTLGLQDAVIMTGNRNDVPDLLRAMDVFILTSFSEGLSVSAVEAQASGLPCVLPTSVSPETDVAGLVTFIPLEESAQVWAQAIVKAAESDTQAAIKQFMAGGYDISSASERLYKKFISFG